MELYGTMTNGVIVPDDAAVVRDGTRVRYEAVSAGADTPVPVYKPPTFADVMGHLCGAAVGLPDGFGQRRDGEYLELAAKTVSVGEPPSDEPLPCDKPKTFGDYFRHLQGVADGLPEDLSTQHEHYRLGTPKR